MDLTFIQKLETASTAGNAPSAGGNVLGTLIMLGAFVLFFYFVLLRPQKRKEKESQNMRGNLQVGDEIATIGGIVGIIVKIGEDTIVIETGGDKSKLRIKTWAVQENITAKEIQEEAIRKAKAEKLAKSPYQAENNPEKKDKAPKKD